MFVKTYYFADLCFKAVSTIKTVPEFHGPRFSAYFRFACKSAGLIFSNCCVGVMPFRYGSSFIERGETLRVRLVLTGEGAEYLSRLCGALYTTCGHGAFSSESLRLAAVYDGITGEEIDFSRGQTRLEPFNNMAVANEVKVLSCFEYFTLDFFSPLRLLLPAGRKLSSAAKIDRLCKEDYFSRDDLSLLHIVSSVKDLGEWPCQDETLSAVPLPWSCITQWSLVKYSQERQMHLDGLTGQICFRGRIMSSIMAERLAAGQYLGIGQNRRFGNGFYQITELNPVRKIKMPKSPIFE